MNYLFFDLESANSHDFNGNIYSSGYTLTSTDLKKDYKQEDILINPVPSRWDWYVVKNMLAYPKQQIRESKRFFEHYDVIKSLLENNIVFGFAILNDIKYLVNDCKRYGLEYLQFKYIDVKDMISTLENRKSSGLGAEYLNFTCNLANGAHRSDIDAFYTKEIVKALLKKHGEDVIQGYISNNIKFTNDLDLESFNVKKEKSVKCRVSKEGQENHIKRGYENYTIFHKLLEEVKKEEGYKDIFNGKKISISLNYEAYNCKEMLSIIQTITNHGGEYIKKASQADIFVTYDSDNECSRLKFVNEELENGKIIEIVKFDDFIKQFS